MKRLLFLGLAVIAAGVAWYQAGTPPHPLARLFPNGALLYLEAKDFSRLLNDWNRSGVKQDWLGSANFSEFERSNLYVKLNAVYQAYGAAAGFNPDMATLLSLAGDQSALALYDLQHVQFAYVTRLPESRAAQTRLWLSRRSFSTREASGLTFYVRSAQDSTVAFAAANGYLLVATGEERMAGMLGLLGGKNTANIAEEGWYKQPTEAAGNPADLRLVMNLENLVAGSYFRSYWVQRNVSEVRHYLSGVADIQRSPAEIREKRIFFKRLGLSEEIPDAEALTAASSLVPLAPDDAGLYRVWAKPLVSDVESLLEGHIFNPHATDDAQPHYAPQEEQSANAGSEADLETRIDEPPLPKPGSQPSLSSILLAQNEIVAMLQVQSSKLRPGATFLSLPCAVAILNRNPWDAQTIQNVIGESWTDRTAGAYHLYQQANLGRISFAVDGPLLVIANDADLLQSILNRPRTQAPAFDATYTATFRHARERANYDRLATALDFGPSQAGQQPSFFSANIASLSAALRWVNRITLTERARPDRVEQTIIYGIQ
jgi:hypothetical protein